MALHENEVRSVEGRDVGMNKRSEPIEISPRGLVRSLCTHLEALAGRGLAVSARICDFEVTLSVVHCGRGVCRGIVLENQQ